MDVGFASGKYQEVEHLQVIERGDDYLEGGTGFAPQQRQQPEPGERFEGVQVAVPQVEATPANPDGNQISILTHHVKSRAELAEQIQGHANPGSLPAFPGRPPWCSCTSVQHQERFILECLPSIGTLLSAVPMTAGSVSSSTVSFAVRGEARCELTCRRQAFLWRAL